MYTHSPNLLNNQTPLNDQKPPRWKKFAVAAFLIIALVIIFLVLRRQSLNRWSTSPTDYDAVTLQPKQTSIFTTVKNFILNSNNVLDGQSSDRVNILLLGIGGPGHDGPYLSDTNIIASIKPSTKEITLISIPRDLGVSTKENGWRKINSISAFGEVAKPGYGGEYARQIFSQTFNLDIQYYIRLDFKAFTEIIDAIGGVEVDVPKTFTDANYPGPNFSYQTIQFTAGKQLMDGTRALDYSRSRHGDNGEGSDFARAHRQQLVIASLKSKLLSADTFTNPVTIQKILSSLNEHLTTDLDFGQLMYLASLAKNGDWQIKSLVLDSSEAGYLINTTGENGAFMLSPKTGDFATINKAIADVFGPSDTTTDESPQIINTSGTTTPLCDGSKLEIQNGTWLPGLAAKVKDRLNQKNYNILNIGNSLKKPIETTTIYPLKKDVDNKCLLSLSKTLRAPTVSTVPDWLKYEYDNTTTAADETGMKYNNESDILIILGTDLKE